MKKIQLLALSLFLMSLSSAYANSITWQSSIKFDNTSKAFAMVHYQAYVYHDGKKIQQKIVNPMTNVIFYLNENDLFCAAAARGTDTNNHCWTMDKHIRTYVTAYSWPEPYQLDISYKIGPGLSNF